MQWSGSLPAWNAKDGRPMTDHGPIKRVVSTPGAPGAIGPYSQAVQAGPFLYLSGQVPLDPATGQVVEGDVAAQTDRVMRNLQAVLEAAGGSMASIVKTTCYLTDMGDFPAFNEVYGGYFPVDPPARETVQVSRLPKDVRLEVSAVALLGGGHE
jgi:2-iminobutanoate/2-iminopropanoate deaminase